MRRVAPYLSLLLLLAPGALAQDREAPEEPAPPDPATPLLALRCPPGAVTIEPAAAWPATPEGEDRVLRLGDGVELAEGRRPVALELVDPDHPADQPTWVWMAPGTNLRIQERRGPDHPRVPGLDLLLRWGRILVCRQGPEEAPRPWTTRVITLDGEVLVGVGSAVIRSGELYGNAAVTTLRGRAGVAKWGLPWEEEYRVVPAGFRRQVDQRGPEAGEAFLWKVNPDEFLAPFGLAGSCGPGGESCRGAWKPRPRPTGWWGR